MNASPPDPEKLSIRCPGCGQRFKVDVELRDRMVECGTCENRFRVNDEVIVRSRKYYPGERRDASLDVFSRVPRTAAARDVAFQPMHYAEPPVAATVEPGSPLRLLMGFTGLAIALVVALILVFGNATGGILDGTPIAGRLILAGFGAVIAGALLVGANPRARKLAALGAVVIAAGLLALPFFFRSESAYTQDQSPEMTEASATDEPDELSGRAREIADIQREVRYEPVARARESSPTAAAVLLRNLREFHRFQVRDFIVRKTGADESPGMYPRGEDHLMVITGIDEDFLRVVRVCEQLGEVNRSVPELRLVDVTIDASKFEEGPLDKLIDPTDPAFYELNRRELESIDLNRIRRAVSRLAEAEPKFFRQDIVQRMVALLDEGDFALRLELGRALATWSVAGDGSDAVVLRLLENLPEAEDVPGSLVEFLVKRNPPGILPVVEKLWLADPARWEDSFGTLGPQIEPLLIQHFPETTKESRDSAIRLLGRVGTTRAIPVLEADRDKVDPETKFLIERSLESIRDRK